jgi:hypothetical protein
MPMWKKMGQKANLGKKNYDNTLVLIALTTMGQIVTLHLVVHFQF